MNRKTVNPSRKPGPPRPQNPVDMPHRAPPAEPAEVLGDHSNSGQKDHKGAR